jgi:pyridine nucleotide-disulfide oxidoreductase family protein
LVDRRILLIGAGHSHIEVIRRWSEEKVPGVSLTVVDPSATPVYSGMVPGYIAGQYEQRDLEIDLSGLCSKSGANFIHDAVVATDSAKSRVRCADGDEIDYDVASIDIGSAVAGTDLPGVIEHALPSRPIGAFLRHIDALANAGTATADRPLLVVGAGAGGVEVALCLDARLRASNNDLSPSRVQIVTPNRSLLEGGTPSAQRAIERQARARGIIVHRGRKVQSVYADRVAFEDGEAIPCAGVAWVTGPAAIPVAAGFDLPKDDRGFIQVDETFRVRGVPNLFAVGDCASLQGMKKAGVYAVRAGPVIDANLRSFVEGTPLRAYTPQSDFLSLLNLGNGEAIGTKWGVSWRGKSMMRLKDRIDRAFMDKYQ